jgi:hypothetical protein
LAFIVTASLFSIGAFLTRNDKQVSAPAPEPAKATTQISNAPTAQTQQSCTKLAPGSNGAKESSFCTNATTQNDKPASDVPWVNPAVYGPYSGLASERVIEMVAAFEKRMAESNRPKAVKESLKQPLITKQEVQQAQAALSLVVHTDAKYAPQAQKLLDLIWNDEEEGRRATQAAAAKAVADDVDGRKAYAKELERNFLSGGFDVTVNASGPKANILTLRFVLFSRPTIYNLVTDANGKETDFPDKCRKMGFAKIVFTDGYDKTWTYALQTAKSTGAVAQ